VSDKFDQLFNLMGKPENDPAFKLFAAQLDNKPSIQGPICTFWNGGLMFFSQKRIIRFVAVDVSQNDSEDVEEFLPAGIRIGDNRREVQIKLGVKPVKSEETAWVNEKHLWDFYEMGPYTFTVILDADSEIIQCVRLQDDIDEEIDLESYRLPPPRVRRYRLGQKRDVRHRGGS
jgi:hypothetical protein